MIPQIILPEIIQTPMSLAISDQDDLFYVASASGLHEFKLSTAELAKTIRHETCMDVLIIDAPSELFNNRAPSKRLLIAIYSLSEDPRATDNVRIAVYPFPYNQVDATNWVTVAEVECQSMWGRVRKAAYSKKYNWLFLSTKYDDADKTQQSSAIWRLCLRNLEHICHAFKQPSNMWYMAVDDDRDFLIVSDLGDDNNHEVVVRDLSTGQYLYTLAHSPYIPNLKSARIPTAYIKWPRGVCVDSLGRVYVVDGDSCKINGFCRIQEFDADGQKSITLEPRLLCNNAKSVVLLEKSHANRKLFVIGDQSQDNDDMIPDSSKIAYSVLFACEVKDDCACDVCSEQQQQRDGLTM